MVNTQEALDVDYPEHTELLDEARRRADDPADPADFCWGGRFDEIRTRRGFDWCLSVTGHYPRTGRYDRLDSELLAVADERDLTPPLPAAVAAARAAADRYLAARTAQEQALRAEESAAWAAARAEAAGAGVELTAWRCLRAQFRGGFSVQVGHAVPTVTCWSGNRRPRTHAAGAGLCESAGSLRPLRLEDRTAPDAAVTCERCLVLATTVRPTR